MPSPEASDASRATSLSAVNGSNAVAVSKPAVAYGTGAMKRNIAEP